MMETEETLQQLDQLEQPEEQPTQPVVEKQEERSPEKENWRLMREREKQLERERDEAHRRLKEYESLIASKQHVEEDEVNLNPDDIPEWKHVDKKIKGLEKKLAGYQQMAAEAAVEARLKAQYPDFDSVVNANSIDILKTTYPELASTINSSGDLYNKAVSAYTIIRNMGIMPDSNSYARDRELAHKNTSKPRPLASVSPQEGSDGPLSKANAFANGLTEELKTQLYKEMMEIRKRT